jgi:hypothetical protein
MSPVNFTDRRAILEFSLFSVAFSGDSADCGKGSAQ